MLFRSFINKCNTIIKGSKANTGLNPVAELNYGGDVTRMLLQFNTDYFQELIDEKEIANPSAATYTLKMTNCFSVDALPYEKELVSGFGCSKERAASFDLLLLRIPHDFDMGRGFDNMRDMWIPGNKSYSEDGCTWYQYKTNNPWDSEGALSTDEIVKAYEDYSAGNDSIMIGRQHFDFGNENLNIDITSYVNDVLANKYPNYGLMLCFSPATELIADDKTHYVGFFTDHTNTFFHPFVEIDNHDYIKDDRSNFRLNKDNKLYLYVTDDGEPVNLDEIPTCEIDGVKYDVQQARKGVYFASVRLLSSDVEEDTILCDKWSNLALNGAKIDDVEMEFVALAPSVRATSSLLDEKDLVPSISNLNDNEKLSIGEIRAVNVDFRIKYTTDKKELIDGADYRLYIKDGNREIDILNYQPIEHTFMNNFFVIDTNWLIPNEYYVDVRVKRGYNVKYYKKAVTFKVVSNITRRYL